MWFYGGKISCMYGGLLNLESLDTILDLMDEYIELVEVLEERRLICQE